MGGIAQETVEAKASSYIGKIQNRVDKEFNEGDPGSILYQLQNSAFYTWNETINAELGGGCWCKPPEDGFCNCGGDVRCDVYDGYRNGLYVAGNYADCGGPSGGPCLAEGDFSAVCNQNLELAKTYAHVTYANMAFNVTEAADLELRFVDYINEVVLSPPTEDMCAIALK